MINLETLQPGKLLKARVIIGVKEQHPLTDCEIRPGDLLLYISHSLVVNEMARYKHNTPRYFCRLLVECIHNGKRKHAIINQFTTMHHPEKLPTDIMAAKYLVNELTLP